MSDQTKKDTARAASRTFKSGAVKDTARAASRTFKSGDKPKGVSRFESPMPTFEERERAAGLFLAGNDPLSGRRKPPAQRDSEDGIETIEIRRTDKAKVGLFNLQPVQFGTDKIRIRYGVCHGIVPKVDYGGELEITSDLDDAANPEITVAASGKLYIKVDLATDTYEAENPVIKYAATVPADVDRVNAHHELAAVTWDSADGGSITAIVPVHGGNIDMASCGGVINYWDLNA